MFAGKTATLLRRIQAQTNNCRFERASFILCHRIGLKSELCIIHNYGFLLILSYAIIHHSFSSLVYILAYCYWMTGYNNKYSQLSGQAS